MLPEEPQKSFELYINEKRKTPNLSIYECGYEKCAPTHSFGPIKRTYFLFHFVVSGHGTYEVDGKKYPVGPNQFFQIVPGVSHYYHADPNDPWQYYWIGFHGEEAFSLIEECHLKDQWVFSIKKSDEVLALFRRIQSSEKRGPAFHYLLLSSFYDLISLIVDDRVGIPSQKSEDAYDYVGKVISYVESHYPEAISVKKIADILEINRSHLYRVFKKSMGIGLEEYILNVRFTNALLLLKKNEYTTKQIAESVGFQDYPNFLKTFKKRYGVTPKHYRSDPFETEH